MIGHGLGTRAPERKSSAADLDPERASDLRRSIGASDGNRTRVSSLGSWRSTIELRSRNRREPSSGR